MSEPNPRVSKNPNISINVGIRKLRSGSSMLATGIGVTLQCGVIAMAGLVSWRAGWTRDGISNTTVSSAALRWK